jgi:hypothetical protein
VLFPVRVVVPLDCFLVSEDDVRLPIAIHVRDGETVPDVDFIDFLDTKLRFGRGGEGEPGEETERKAGRMGQFAYDPFKGG